MIVLGTLDVQKPDFIHNVDTEVIPLVIHVRFTGVFENFRVRRTHLLCISAFDFFCYLDRVFSMRSVHLFESL